jgi:hypothetical protein
LMFLALPFITQIRYLLAYFSVLMVSSNCAEAGDTFAIMTVLQLPPRLSFNNRVSFESR